MNRRYSPFEELDALFERMGRGFDVDAGHRFDFDSGHRAFDADVRTDDESVVVSADLPGFDREDIDVSLDGRTLTVRAERTTGSDDEADDYVRRERRHDSVSRRLRLPVEVDEDGAEAAYNNGVLTVSLPRVDGDDGHHIDIDVE